MSKKLASLIAPNKKFIINRYTWNVRHKDDILSIGSIITWMTGENSIIWGSGIVYPENEISAIPKKVLAVRGPLTREYLLKRGIDCPEVYGDPALLFPRYYQPKIKKKYRLGIIPHFRDKHHAILSNFINDKTVLIINVQKIKPWHKFIDDICSCESIATSSLHGLIVSDAYHIPNLWIEFPQGEQKHFAFRDYLQSVGSTIKEPFLLNESTTVMEMVTKSKRKVLEVDTEKLLKVCPFTSVCGDFNT